MMDDRRRSWRKDQLNSSGIQRTASDQAARRSMMLSVMLLITRLSLSVRHFGMEIVKWIHFYGSFFTSMKWTDQYLPIKEAWMLQRFSDAMGTIEKQGKQVWFSYVFSLNKMCLNWGIWFVEPDWEAKVTVRPHAHPSSIKRGSQLNFEAERYRNSRKNSYGSAQKTATGTGRTLESATARSSGNKQHRTEQLSRRESNTG